MRRLEDTVLACCLSAVGLAFGWWLLMRRIDAAVRGDR